MSIIENYLRYLLLPVELRMNVNDGFRRLSGLWVAPNLVKIECRLEIARATEDAYHVAQLGVASNRFVVPRVGGAKPSSRQDSFGVRCDSAIQFANVVKCGFQVIELGLMNGCSRRRDCVSYG